MAARKIGGLELEIKPSDASVRDVPCSRDPKAAMAPAVAQSLWIKVHHLACWSRKLLPPFPLQKKSLIQAIENICKSNYLPRALPGALPPPCSLRSLRLGFLQPGCFPGHTKGWMQALLGSSFTHSNSASTLPASAPTERQGQGAHLQPWGGWWEPGGRIQALHPRSQPTCSRGVLRIPLLGSGLLALLLASLTPCGERDRGHRDTPSRLLSH